MAAAAAAVELPHAVPFPAVLAEWQPRSDVLLDRFWSREPDPYRLTEVLCAYPNCHNTCYPGSDMFCVLCPYVCAHNPRASFFYCDEHCTSLNDALGTDDGEGLCDDHVDTAEKALFEPAAARFGGQMHWDLPEDSPDRAGWEDECARRVRLYRWQHFSRGQLLPDPAEEQQPAPAASKSKVKTKLKTQSKVAGAPSSKRVKRA